VNPSPLGAAQRFVEAAPALPLDVADVAAEPVRDRAARRSLRWIAELRASGNLFGAFDVPTNDLATLEVPHLQLGARLDLVALPGEPFQASARTIRADRDGAVLIAGYANQSAGYLPPSHEFARFGYEIGCVTATVPDSDPRHRAAAHRLPHTRVMFVSYGAAHEAQPRSRGLLNPSLRVMGASPTVRAERSLLRRSTARQALRS
jgi:hypothetical protein